MFLTSAAAPLAAIRNVCSLRSFQTTCRVTPDGVVTCTLIGIVNAGASVWTCRIVSPVVSRRPAHSIARARHAVDPFLEEPVEALAVGTFAHCAEVFGGHVAVAVLGNVRPQCREESLLAHHSSQHVEHPGALVECCVAEQLLVVRDVGDEYRALQISCGELAHLGAVRRSAIPALLPQHRSVGGEAFIQPHMSPVAYRQAVAEPLMRELVRQDGDVGVVARDQAFGIARQRLVLAEAVGGEFRDAVLLAQKGIFAEAFDMTAHDVRDDAELAPRLVLVGRKDIELQGHDRAVGRTIAILEHLVLGDRDRDGVRIDGIRNVPAIRPPAVGVAVDCNELAVGCSRQRRRNGDDEVGRISLVRRVIFARPPLTRSERQTVVRDGRLSIALREREALASWSAVICHHYRERLSPLRWFLHGDDDLVVLVLELRWLAADGHAIDGERVRQIQGNLCWRSRQELCPRLDDSAQRLRGGIHAQVQAVVLHVHCTRRQNESDHSGCNVHPSSVRHCTRT